jgi:hypothetical protein
MQDNDNRQRGGPTRLLVPAVVIGLAIIFLVLHLAGVFGAGSH